MEQRCKGGRTECKLFHRESQEVPQWQGLLRSSQSPQLLTLSPLVGGTGQGALQGAGTGALRSQSAAWARPVEKVFRGLLQAAPPSKTFTNSHAAFLRWQDLSSLGSTSVIACVPWRHHPPDRGVPELISYPGAETSGLPFPCGHRHTWGVTITSNSLPNPFFSLWISEPTFPDSLLQAYHLVPSVILAFPVWRFSLIALLFSSPIILITSAFLWARYVLFSFPVSLNKRLKIQKV